VIKWGNDLSLRNQIHERPLRELSLYDRSWPGQRPLNWSPTHLASHLCLFSHLPGASLLWCKI